MQDKLSAEGHYHAGHLPASPMQAQGTDQYPGGYGHQQFMQEMDQSGVQSCESSWSETGSDFTVTNPHSPYMVCLISCFNVYYQTVLLVGRSAAPTLYHSGQTNLTL